MITQEKIDEAKEIAENAKYGSDGTESKQLSQLTIEPNYSQIAVNKFELKHVVHFNPEFCLELLKEFEEVKAEKDRLIQDLLEARNCDHDAALIRSLRDELQQYVCSLGRESEESEKLRDELEEAREIIEFYGDRYNWDFHPTDINSAILKNDCSGDLIIYRGGKRAREYLAKRSGK